MNNVNQVKKRVVLIGCGKRANKLYVPLLKKLESIISCEAVYSRTAEKAKYTGELLGVTSFSNLYEMIESVEFDIAIITTEKKNHLEPSIACINAGKHLLLETPIAESLDDATAIISAGKNAGVMIEVAENYPRNPFLLFLRSCIEADLFGKINTVYSNYIGHGYHGISCIRQLLGNSAIPKTIRGFSKEFPVVQHIWREGFPEKNSEIWSHGIIDFEDNAVGIFDFSSLTYGSPLRREQTANTISLYGEKGMVWNNQILLLEGTKNRKILPVKRKLNRINDKKIIKSISINDPKKIEWKNPLVNFPLDESELEVALCLLDLLNAIEKKSVPYYGVENAFIDRKIEALMAMSAENNSRPIEFSRDSL